MNTLMINTELLNYSMSNAKKLYNQGILAEESGDLEAAIKFYESSIDLNPEFVKSFQNLGSVYSKLGDKDKAIDFFQKAILISPTEETYYNLSVEYYKMNNLEGAIHNLKKSLECNKRYVNSHLLLAYAYEKSGREDKTEIYLTNVIRIDPKNKTALRGLLLFYYERDRLDESLDLINRYISFYPNDGKFTILKSDILSRKGSYTESVAMLTELTKTNSKFTSFTDKLDELKSNESIPEKEYFRNLEAKTKNKIREFKTKLELSKENPDDFSPPNPQDAVDLSLMYLFNGDPEKAMKYLVYAKKINSENTN